MKKTFLAGISSLLLSLFGAAHAQIPTIDVKAILEAQKQAQTMLDQLNQIKAQYNQQVAQFQSLTGNRGFGNLYNDPQLRQYLPQQWQQVYNNLQGQGLAGLTPGAQALRQQYGSNYNCEAVRGVTERRICEQQVGKNFQDADVFQTALQSANQRTNVIAGLQGEIANTNDPKAIAELQARIQVEQANLQNEMNKMQLSVQLAEIQNKLIQQQGEEIVKRRLETIPNIK